MRRLPLAAAVLAVGLAAAGCGGSHREDARARVNAYVQRANGIERQLAGGFKRANATYAAFSGGKLRPHRSAVRLRAAEHAISSARDRLAALHPPEEARVLHQRLLRYFGMAVRFARQSTLLARYQGSAPAAMVPLTRANIRLRADLPGASPSEQASALIAFEATTQRTLDHLSALHAPAILQAAHEQQLRRLRITRSLARRLHDAVLGDDAPRIAHLVLRFRRNATASGDARRQAKRAVAGYQERLRALSRAYADVRREQIRLDRSLR